MGNRQATKLEEVLQEILDPNSVTYKSIYSWMYHKYLVEDATAELAGYLWKKYKDNPEAILKKYNNEKHWIGFISIYVKHQLQNNSSIFFRRYNTSYKFDDLTSDTKSNDDNLNQLLEDKLREEEKPARQRLSELDGKDLQETLIRILSNKRAIVTFEKEHRDIYYYYYLSEPSKQIPTYKLISEELGIKRRDLMRILKPIRKFLKDELKFIEDNGLWDQYILLNNEGN